MKTPAKVVMKVTSVKGTCEVGHRVGQDFDLSREVTLAYSGNPQAICPALYYAIYPNLRLLRFGGSLPWEKDPDEAYVACPDPLNPVVVQLKRVKE
jgi:uncharacterized repeat protein (TIGR04076 family)